MGKKAKTGKNRQDKFYHLAKEQGFRSRAAFKLVQLNKRHDFLSSASRGVLDLCAAPGGWMQVARKHMPLGAPCVGIDLVPIRAVSGCAAITGDITSDSTRGEIRRVLNETGTGDKVDVVLNDGSPNMGKAWLHDAYSQSELTLAALKLASDFLSPGGTFVTKVFRSNDYNSLLFVMHQLFNRVNATKPTASRNESAEIYVICIGFKAPKSIDSRLLNPKYVFKDLSAADFTDDKGDSKPDLFLNTVLKDIKKQKRNRDGYRDDETTFFKKVSILEFCETPRPVALMVGSSQFSFEPRLMADRGFPENDAKRVARLLENLDETTSEFLSCCEDLKVLARREFKLLLKWRLAARKCLIAANLLNTGRKSNDVADSPIEKLDNVGFIDDLPSKRSRGAHTDEDALNFSEKGDSSDDDQDAEFDEQVTKARTELLAAEKRKRRKANKARKVLQRKIDMKIVLPDEEAIATVDTPDALFSLKAAKRAERHGIEMVDVPVDVANVVVPEVEESDGYQGDDEVVGMTIEGEKILKRRRNSIKLQDPEVAQSEEVNEIEKNLDRWYKIYLTHRKVDKNGVVLKESKERQRIARRRAAKEQRESLQADEADSQGGAEIKLVVDSSESSDNEETKESNDDSDENMKNISDNSDEESDDDIQDNVRVNFNNRDPHGNLLAETKQSREAALWFSQPLFDGAIHELSEDPEEILEESHGSEREKETSQEDFHSAAKFEAERLAEERKKGSEIGVEDFEVVAQGADESVGSSVAVDDTNQVSDRGGEDSESSFHSSDYDTDEKAEMMAIGREMRRSKRNTDEMLDEGYHRYTFDDPLEMPRWFTDQDGVYRSRTMPIRKEQVEEMKDYIKSLANAPTKKEAEAKARRRARLEKKMESMKIKANSIAEQNDLSVNSRMKAIEDLYKQAMKSSKSSSKKKRKVYQVMKPTGRMIVGKTAGKGRNGLKGAKLTLVDRRMKSDKRGVEKAGRKRGGKAKK